MFNYDVHSQNIWFIELSFTYKCKSINMLILKVISYKNYHFIYSETIFYYIV